jgi:hypothetical protein
MTGGLGDDTYVVDATGDKVVEAVNQGTDSVTTSVLLTTAAANVENYTYTGTANWTFAGNDLNNVIQGSSGNDKLDGGKGDDTAIFTGNLSDYQITYNGGSVTIADMNGATNGANGTDTLTNFEHIQFADTTLDLPSGFKGVAAGDEAGFRVSGLGDVNGDGHADFIIGAPFADANGKDSGAAYVVYGTGASFPGTFDLSNLNGANGFKITGEAVGDAAGFSVHSVGDFNGDGISDFIIGAPNADPDATNSGAAYLIFGHDGTSPANLSLASLNGSNGFELNGALGFDFTGNSVSSAGDVNGDGYDDLIIGAYRTDGDQTYSGGAYVVFGHGGSFASEIDLSSLNGTTGFKLDGVLGYDQAGWSVSSAGDVNGDGVDDIIVGANWGANFVGAYAGAAYIVFGHTGSFSSDVDLSNLNGANGFTLGGISQGDQLGFSVSSAGDINGDGFADIIAGEPYAAGSGGAYFGAAHIVFGHAGTFASHIDAESLNETTGIGIWGPNKYGYVGLSVSSAGDVNGDGYADIIVGAPGLGTNYQGAAYVIFGHSGNFANDFVNLNFDLSLLTPAEGFEIHGAASLDNAGVSVSAAGDLNGDGFSDLLVGAPFADPHGNSSGSVTVVYGGDFNSSTSTVVVGTSADDNLVGTSSAEVIAGGAGNDDIRGNGGADAIQGGDGNDQIHVSDHSFFRIDGGNGTDTLHLDFAGAIDFGNLDGNAATSDRGKIAGIETISVDNGQANALTLHLADVLDMHVENTNVGSVASLDNVLKIDGDTNDTLALTTADGWSQTPDTSTLAGYAIYTNHNVHVAVDTDIHVTVS